VTTNNTNKDNDEMEEAKEEDLIEDQKSNHNKTLYELLDMSNTGIAE
jgi:hypothetical protein